ncbi:putative amino acid permease [Phaeomoniella chlamydospora]|uniref:Putative amino acid permease n=1 Tax=Phaeomoniella chlamydospora TaxID=158046 RepID=A0A0G2EHD5_PHACM|nr:putative amino acid permease [Phaeomoniella chlamydospora]
MESKPANETEKKVSAVDETNGDQTSEEQYGTVHNIGHLSRKLSWRQMQLMIIGGSIGTALFVTIGAGLMSAGPGSLFLAFVIYSIFLACCNNCMAEMSTYMPISGGWIRMASHWVDDALGFALGWNFFLYEATLIPYEISALNLVITFWSDNIPPAAICCACIVAYGTHNVNLELILIFLVFGFTFVTMVGGNPQHDAYGFRYWKTPGAFAEYITTGSLGRFEGFLSGLWRAAFVIVGPEYCAMLAAEAKYPRKTLKKAFKTMYFRFALFFIGGALAVGIVIPYNDATLVAINSGEADGSGTGAASPYVIAMQNMGIGVLPHITNALLMTSIFSAGNSYVYCASRTLYSLALDGHAPKVLRKLTKSGVPIYCFAITMIFPFLSLLILGSNASQVVLWLANLTTAAQIIDFIGMCLVYIFFHRAMQAQNFSRDTLPYKGYFQPYSAWAGLIFMIFVVCCYGYAIFLPGSFSVGDFFIYYLMVFVCIVLYLGWKFIKKTKVIPALEVDLIWEAPAIDAYEVALAEEEDDDNSDGGLWDEVRRWRRTKFGKKNGDHE